MKKSIHWLYAILIGTIVLTIGAAILLTRAYFTDFDPELGYFSVSAVKPSLAYALILLLAIGAILVLSIPIQRDTLVNPSRNNEPIPSRISGIIVGLGLLLFAIAGILTAKDAASEIIQRLILIRSILSIPAAFYFFACSFRLSEVICNVTSVFALFMGVTLLGSTYFDYFTPMNGPVKIPLQLATVVFLLSLLSEIRLQIGGNYARPRMAVFFSLMTFAFSITVSVPLIVAQLIGILQKPDYLLCAFLLILIGIHQLLLVLRFFPGKQRPVIAKDDLENVADVLQDADPEACNWAENNKGADHIVQEYDAARIKDNMKVESNRNVESDTAEDNDIEGGTSSVSQKRQETV